jgi:hypothetical protein
MKMHWTRDPFDRLIAVNTQAGKALFVTRDKVILKNGRIAVELSCGIYRGAKNFSPHGRIFPVLNGEVDLFTCE